MIFSERNRRRGRANICWKPVSKLNRVDSLNQAERCMMRFVRRYRRFLIVMAGIAMLSGCVVAPGYGYGYRVHPIIHPAWRGWGWRR